MSVKRNAANVICTVSVAVADDGIVNCTSVFEHRGRSRSNCSSNENHQLCIIPNLIIVIHIPSLYECCH